jgi:hypothetical protein
MYAAQVLGTGSSNGLPLAAIDAAEYADVLLAERRKRFPPRDDARGVEGEGGTRVTTTTPRERAEAVEP